MPNFTYLKRGETKNNAQFREGYQNMYYETNPVISEMLVLYEVNSLVTQVPS